jgi:hypothetical protein
MSDLTKQDQFFIERSEDAIRAGQALRQFCLNPPPGTVRVPLNLGKPFRLPNKAEAFFGKLEGSGTSVMGASQDCDYGRFDSPRAAELLKEFVLGHFLGRATWTNPDGFPGGFGVSRTIFRRMDGTYGKFAENECAGCIDWRQLGRDYQWVLLLVQIHDFVMPLGPFQKRLKEAAMVVMHPSFLEIRENPSKDCVLSIDVGYPFIKFAPIPNFFGYGPGKFENAVKLYSFRLGPDNHVRAGMEFASAPRCAKVFDFGRSVPDPVYGGASVFHRLSFGRWNLAAFHDKLDAGMLAQHCRVHQALLDGVENVWRDWRAAAK